MSNIKIEAKLNLINDRVLELAKEPGFFLAKELIVDIVSLLGVQLPERVGDRYNFLQDQKYEKNEPWFGWHERFPDKRAGEILNHVDDIPVEIKIYWLNKVMPSRVKGVVHFTDNYEDSKRTRDDVNSKVGIDFVINSKADGIIIALSNYGVVRVLEIKDRLNNTQKKILSDWIEIGSGEYNNKREFLHTSLWNSFEIKTVNEEFYLMISRTFTNLKQYLEDNKIFKEEDAKQFANRLIGRLLFVWFLKKKGFIFEEKIPYFDTDNMSDKEYYTERLEKLFFNTLNKPMEERDILNDDLKTPYLNGGLFYTYDNDKPKKEISFPEHFFAGLYKNLNEYNFTTDESTPDFEQVAIDPEMLGRIFENLLASMMTETGKQARKAKGAFYTPREIVQYMCRESIREHLYNKLGVDKYKLVIDQIIDTADHEWALNETNKVQHISKKDNFGEKVIEAIKDIKVLDPACGSGAFPLGMLQNLLRIYLRLNRRANEYETKIKILEQNIYGVDIEPMAVEISRLRSFLALIVDQEYNEKNKNGGIDTLPNLEFKFVCANTLFKLSGKQGLLDGLQEGGKKENDLAQELLLLKREYFKARWKKRQKLEIDIEKKLSKQGLFDSEKQKQLRTYHPIHQISPATFYDPLLMHDVETGFDIVIANPPYVSTKGVDAEMKGNLNKEHGFSDDLYAHFYFKGIELLKKKGVLTYITSKTFWTIQTKKNVREKLLENNFIAIYDTANPFESAMVDTCVVVVQKDQKQKNKINFLKYKEVKDAYGKKVINYSEPIKLEVEKKYYEEAVNNVIFYPSKENIEIYNKYNKKVKGLMASWWHFIDTSKKVQTNKVRINKYISELKSSDVILLGLLTEGGQGLATGNNGKYLGVLEGGKEAIKIKEERVKKFYNFTVKYKVKKYGSTKMAVSSYLNRLDERKIWQLFDSMKDKYGRDVFSKGFLHRIIGEEDIKSVENMTNKEKKDGIIDGPSFVPYDKGDKDGNRWYSCTPYYIDWSKNNVEILKTDPKARYQGNDYFFMPGFCWNLTNGTRSNNNLKFRLMNPSVNDVNGMKLYSTFNLISNKFLICLGNSKLINNWSESFINFALAFQVNDARQLPVIIPTIEQLSSFENLFDRAYDIKNKEFDGFLDKIKATEELDKIQVELDKAVYRLYDINPIKNNK